MVQLFSLYSFTVGGITGYYDCIKLAVAHCNSPLEHSFTVIALVKDTDDCDRVWVVHKHLSYCRLSFHF